MFESLVVTLREGVEAALIVAIVIAYIRRIGRPELARSVYLGLAAAVAASVMGAVVFRRLEISEEWFEGWTMLIGSVFVATMVIWMWRTARHLKGEIESRVNLIAAQHAGGFSLPIFSFVFLMVVREGIETVLMLGAVQLNSSSIMGLAGALIGLAAAVFLGVFFVRGSLRVNLRKFFSITSIILIIVSLQLFLSGLHELSEALILPSSATEMAIIGPIVKNSALFYILILALTVLLIVSQRRQKTAADTGGNPAELRKARYRARRERVWTVSIASIALLSITLITTQFVYSRNEGTLSEPEAYFNQGQDVRVPIARVDDGKLHRFMYRTGDRDVRFLIVKLGSGKWGVTLDACQICGDKGYFQKGQDIICRNCIAAINPESIGQSGGCNPLPLTFFADGPDIKIGCQELDSSSQFFAAPAGQK
ncbi:MAG TPA: Fe-S-containing protein [Blastocatellia bacterium]|nr:Fe-S-containing protein [Blastocatellia bacterium]